MITNIDRTTTSTTTLVSIDREQLDGVAGGLGLPHIDLKPIDWGKVGHAALGGSAQGAVKGAVRGLPGGPAGVVRGAVSGAATGGLIAGGKNVLHQEFGWF